MNSRKILHGKYNMIKYNTNLYTYIKLYFQVGTECVLNKIRDDFWKINNYLKYI